MDYIEEVCFSDEAKANNARINRNNSNAFVPKKYIDPSKVRYAVTRAEYIDILSSINEAIATKIISENFHFRMPYKMGSLEIVKKKPKVIVDSNDNVRNYLPIDWGATNKLWKEDPIAKKKKKLIRHKNSNSEGYVFKTTYRKLNSNYANVKVYNFRTSKNYRQLMVSLVRDNPNIDFYLKE